MSSPSLRKTDHISDGSLGWPDCLMDRMHIAAHLGFRWIVTVAHLDQWHSSVHSARFRQVKQIVSVRHSSRKPVEMAAPLYLILDRWHRSRS